MESKKKFIRISANRVIFTSFAVDFLDVILSLVVAILSGSVVMLSQVLEGIADLAASGLLLVGLQRSSLRADRAHPFGHGREIYFWTLLAGLLMFGITASFSIFFGWRRFLHPEPIHNLNLAFLVLGITLITNGYAFWLSLKRILKNRGIKKTVQLFFHSSLIETKATFILDLMGSAASLLGIISLLIYQITNDLRFDGLGAIAIGVTTGIFAYFLILSIKDLLIGKSASLEAEAAIRKATMKVKEVKNVLDLKTMHIGSEKLLVNLEVHLTNNLTTDQIEKLVDKIKENILKEVPAVKHIQVELETPGK